MAGNGRLISPPDRGTGQQEDEVTGSQRGLQMYSNMGGPDTPECMAT